MEIIRGKQASFMDAAALTAVTEDYPSVHLDLGTGDGRYVAHQAVAQPRHFVIGLDACRENLVEVSRRAPGNSLFVIANALDLPGELDGMADSLSINFPWGSLLEGLLLADSPLWASLRRVTRPGTRLDVRLNGGALAEAHWSLETGAVQIRRMLIEQGFALRPAEKLTAGDLKAFPTSWAKRLAFGRDPRAIHLTGLRQV
ncbi:MAG: class I SAM-dependent methyltransferase [Anaerolineae bacterium]|nr:class I SAM-dependent methyltransferase [Anaerolineae bacterium]